MVALEKAYTQIPSGFIWKCAFIFLLALTIRWVYLWEIKSSFFFTNLMGDAQRYDAWAREIVAGDLWGEQVFYQAPLYPYLLGAIYGMSGHDLLIVRILQTMGGALSCVLVAAGAELFFSGAGLLSGILLAFYPPAIFHDGLIQKTSTAFLLMSVLFLIIAKLIHQDRPFWWFMGGMTLGLLGLVRENALILVLVFFGLLIAGLHKGRIMAFILFMAGLSVILGPVVIRNQLVGGELVLTTSQCGPNLYIGNCLSTEGSYSPLRFNRSMPEYESLDAMLMAENAVGHALTPSEVSRYWINKTIGHMRTNFSRWTFLMIRKGMLVWNVAEIGDTEDQYTYTNFSSLLRILSSWFHFGILCPLAFAGILLTWSQYKTLWPLYLALACFSSSIIIFYVLARYRLPLIIFMIPFASVGIIRVKELFNRRMIMGSALILVTVLLSNLQLVVPAKISSNTYYNGGCVLLRQDRLHAAESFFKTALSLNQDNLYARLNIGNIRIQQGHPEKAAVIYADIIQRAPFCAEAYYNLGNYYMDKDRPEAIYNFQRALQLKPNFKAAGHNLAIMLNQKSNED